MSMFCLQIYSGKWQDSVGTHLFFEPQPNPETSPDPVFSNDPSTILNYKFKTRKCLGLSRVFINKKEDQHGEILNIKHSIDDVNETEVS